MVIMSQSGRCITDWEKVKKVYISTNDKGNAVLSGFDDGDSVIMGTYLNEEQCKRAIGYLFVAIKMMETSFEFPQWEDLPDCKANYGSHVKTKSNRRGGS